MVFLARIKSYTIYDMQSELNNDDRRRNEKMHAIEKILAKNSGRESVRTGEIVTAKVDFA